LVFWLIRPSFRPATARGRQRSAGFSGATRRPRFGQAINGDFSWLGGQMLAQWLKASCCGAKQIATAALGPNSEVVTGRNSKLFCLVGQLVAYIRDEGNFLFERDNKNPTVAICAIRHKNVHWVNNGRCFDSAKLR
jgi:hypothetical protein